MGRVVELGVSREAGEARSWWVAGGIKQRGRGLGAWGAPSRGPCTISFVAAAAASCTLAKSSARPIVWNVSPDGVCSRLGL